MRRTVSDRLNLPNMSLHLLSVWGVIYVALTVCPNVLCEAKQHKFTITEGPYYLRHA